jgi:sulfatase maturation enzyme AslB (radical SAM superfamily)
MEPKICAYALGHLNHQLDDNMVSACFRCAAKLGDHSQQVLSDVKNSAAAKEHRMTLMRGEWPEGCNSCRNFEEIGICSTRLDGLNLPRLGLDLENYNANTGEIAHVKSIELRFGNECNLSCRHCSPIYSSRWESIIQSNPSMLKSVLGRDPDPIPKNGLSVEYIRDILENIVPNVGHIAFAGGEPLYQTQHYEFINAIPAEHAAHIELLYVTNGTILNLKKYDILEMWKKFKKVVVIVSTDGVGDKYEYFRTGAKWAIVERNIKSIKAAGYWVGTEITCSVYQMFYLTETFDYLYDSGISDWVSSSIVQFPTLINPQIIPHDVKLLLLEKWENYLHTITNAEKLRRATAIGKHVVNYMMGDNTDISSTEVTWQDFANSVYTADRLFNTDVAKSMPLLAECLPKPQ